MKKLQEETARKQADWADGVAEGSELTRYAIQGTDKDWDAALNGNGGIKAHISLPSTRTPREGGDGSDKKKKKRSPDGAGGSGKKRKDK